MFWLADVHTLSLEEERIGMRVQWVTMLMFKMDRCASHCPSQSVSQ
jgi:hypothetical protein